MSGAQPWHVVLTELAQGADEPLPGFVAALIPHASLDCTDIEDPGFHPLREELSFQAEHLSKENRGPTSMIKALIQIDDALAAAGHIRAPWISRLTPLAAERYCHAARQGWDDDEQTHLAHAAPVFHLDHRTLIAAPVGRLGEEGLQLLVDRILSAILRRKPRRVLLILHGLAPHPGAAAQFDELAADLKKLKVGLDKIQP